jgi:hypothetical protein
MHTVKQLVRKITSLVIIGAFGIMGTGCIVVPHDDGYHDHEHKHERHHHHYSERWRPFL